MKKLHTKQCQAGTNPCSDQCVDVYEAKNVRIFLKNPDGTETVLYEGDGLTFANPKDFELTFGKPQLDVFDDRADQ